MLRNAVGDGRVSDLPEKNVTKMFGSMLLALRGGGWVGGWVGVEFPEQIMASKLGIRGDTFFVVESK